MTGQIAYTETEERSFAAITELNWFESPDLKFVIEKAAPESSAECNVFRAEA
jgi:hypothetical protein